MRYVLIAAGLCLTTATAALPKPPVADSQSGKRAFAQCAGCHSIDGTPSLGPSLRGVYGRKAGSSRTYSYSPAIKEVGLVWNSSELDAFLQSPQKTIPRNRMTFAGMTNDRDRQDVIAFLKALK